MSAKTSNKEPAERVALPNNFADILAAAETAAGDDWEKTFIKEQSERFQKWGDTMFLSPKQLTILQRIAAKATETHD